MVLFYPLKMGRIKPIYCKGNDALVQPQTESTLLISDKEEEEHLILSAFLLMTLIAYNSLWLLTKCISCNFNNFPSAVGTLCPWCNSNLRLLGFEFDILFLASYYRLYVLLRLCSSGLVLWRTLCGTDIYHDIYFQKVKRKFFQCPSVTGKVTFIKQILGIAQVQVTWVWTVCWKGSMAFVNVSVSLRKVWRLWKFQHLVTFFFHSRRT